jgi:hypothetical protein
VDALASKKINAYVKKAREENNEGVATQLERVNTQAIVIDQFVDYNTALQLFQKNSGELLVKARESLTNYLRIKQ